MILGKIVSSVLVPASDKKFIVADKFIEGKHQNAKVIIHSWDDNFRQGFINKIEDPYPSVILQARDLRREADDCQILHHLEQLEVKSPAVSVGEIYDQMCRQPDDFSTALFSYTHANMCYAVDTAGQLRGLVVFYCCGGFIIYAYDFKRPGKWAANRRIIYSTPAVN
jgi:hypothetical protein